MCAFGTANYGGEITLWVVLLVPFFCKDGVVKILRLFLVELVVSTISTFVKLLIMERGPLCSVVISVPFFYRDGVVDIL